MNKLTQLLIPLMLLAACGRPDAVNTREEINESVEGVPIFIPDQADSSLYGVYRGVLPLEDGAVLNRLSLYEDNSFYLQQMCENSAQEICEYRGKFKYDKDSESIRFKADGMTYRFAIGENLLHMIDKKGNKIEASVDQTPYLTKSELELSNTIWQFERIADSLISNETLRLRFHTDGSLTYQISCNSCGGSWDVQVKGEIYLKRAGCTKINCKHPLEEEFHQLIPEIRNYKIEKDKLYLSNKSKVIAVLKSPF